MLYIGNFINIDKEDILVKIITNGDSSRTTELLLAADPVTINLVSDDGLFSPIKAQAATIRVYTYHIYEDMYSNSAKQAEVIVTNLTKNKMIFKGYMTPNIYNLEYIGLDSLELEARCGISILKNIKYQKTDHLVGWYDLIKTALQKAGYDKFYFADSFKYNDEDEDLLSKIYQFEGNFFDNDEEKTPWTYHDILEEFCKYFGLSLVVDGSDIYFVDYNNHTNYIEYTITPTESRKPVTFNNVVLIGQQLYKGTGANISYDETYNKISIKCNLYNNDMEQNPIEDNDLINMDKDPNKYYKNTIDIKEGDETVNYTYVNGFFNNKNWENYNPDDLQIVPENVKLITNMSFWQKVADYKTDEVPSSLTWETYLTAYNDGKHPEASQGTLARMNYDIVRKIKTNDVICNGGYFILNLDYKLSTSFYANDCFKSGDYKYEYKSYNYGIPDTKFPCKLQIGDNFYNGYEWSNYDEYNRKLAKGYYKEVFYMGVDNPRNYYKYKDNDGDWAFCKDKAEYDALPEGTIKESGLSIHDQNSHVAMMYWVSQGVGKPPIRYYIDELYYNECILRDRFYIIRRNKKGDKIFDEVKSLKNTASWEMNIDDSEDGIAIPISSNLINGELYFSVGVPDILGTYPQGRIGVEQLPVVKAVHIKRCNLVYKASGNMVDIFDLGKDENDVLYTNIINDEYVNEWDDMEIKVNTQNDNRITSFSSVIYKQTPTSKPYFLEQVYNKINNTTKLMEEHVVTKYYNHYKTPKIMLNAYLKNVFLPISKVGEPILSKMFAVDSYDFNVEDNAVNIKLIEL